MGILIANAANVTMSSEKSQSPKAGHGYSNEAGDMDVFYRSLESLNPLKRVMGILMASIKKHLGVDQIRLNPLKRVMGILIKFFYDPDLAYQ